MSFPLRLGWLVAFVPALALSCKSESEPEPTCVQTICEAGQKACLGHGVASCASDGKSYNFVACGENEVCTDGACKPYGCTYRGQTKCSDTKTLLSCDESGVETSTTCKPELETCKASACRALPCKPDQVVCGFRELATCEPDGSNWKLTPCAATEICQAGKCVPQACEPGKRRCKDAATLTDCKFDGTGEVDTVCPANQTCDAPSLTCLPSVCAAPSTDGSDTSGGTDGTGGPGDVVTADDAGPEDVGPPPDIGLKVPETGVATIDGEKITFKSGMQAFYLPNEQEGPMLKVVMNAGQKKIEISFQPIEEFASGAFKDTVAGDTNVKLFYHDGSPLVGNAQFRYQSVNYDVDLKSFQAVGERVKGTFSGTLTEDGGKTTIPLENGEFDVERE
jgi:hypothetical protein